MLVLLLVPGCSSESADREDAIVLFDAAFKLYLDDKFEEAVPLFEEAAAKGNSDAECELGVIYELGLGVEIDFSKAFAWYKKSAEHGSCGGLYRYGRCFHKGIGTNVDLEEALHWYERALAMDNKLAGFGIAEVERELNK